MRAAQHSSNNAVLGAPAGWDQNKLPCHAIALTRSISDGMQVVSTYWQLTDDERAAIAAGALVRVTMPGFTVPPMALATEAA
jgi:hypothetical protein